MEDHSWVCTDESCNQYRKQIDKGVFIFKEDRCIDPVSKEVEVFEETISLGDYSQEEMFSDVSSFGYSFDEMCTWLEKSVNLDLIAECIFEMRV